MTKENAFQNFRAGALSRHLPDPTESAHPEAFGGRVSTLQHRGAGLRLVWDGKEGLLILQITHGPLEGPIAWLDLYKAVWSGDQLVPDQADFSFESAVEYGLDLFAPEHSAGVD